MDDMFRYYRESCLNNLCDEYKDLWRKCGNDKEKLVRLVLQQQALPHFITYCNEGKGLSKQYILENFGEFVNGRTVRDAEGVEGFDYMMYVGRKDDKKTIRIGTNVFCSMWCDMHLEVNPTKVPTIYCGCGSTLHITCGGYNYVRIYLFDNSTVILDDVDEESGVTVFKYSKQCTVEYGKYCLSKKTKEFNKELVL